MGIFCLWSFSLIHGCNTSHPHFQVHGNYYTIFHCQLTTCDRDGCTSGRFRVEDGERDEVGLCKNCFVVHQMLIGLISFGNLVKTLFLYMELNWCKTKWFYQTLKCLFLIRCCRFGKILFVK